MYLILILSALTLNMSCAQSVEKNRNIKFIRFVNSFKEEIKSNIIDFRKIINNKDPMSKEEVLEFVYHTDDTTKLYCVEFNYSNENEKFRGILGAFLWLPDKCLKINMENYFLIAYNSYECPNRCPNPNDAYDCFVNARYNKSLILCIVDTQYVKKDSMIVYMEDDVDYSIAGLLNPQNGKIFLYKMDNGRKVYMYEINKTTLKFESIRKENLSSDMFYDDLMKVLEKLNWKGFFME